MDRSIHLRERAEAMIASMVAWFFIVFGVTIAINSSMYQRKAWAMYRAVRPTKSQGANLPPGKELAQPVKTYELYGHPAAPLLVLQASLPSAPLGYGWEIVTAINEVGNPALRLSMLDLKSTTVVDAIEGDLVIIRRWRYARPDTYADFYRRAGEQEFARITGWNPARGYAIYGHDPSKLLGKVMLANLITPMVDWASLLVLRYLVEHPDETKCHYVLLESEAS